MTWRCLLNARLGLAAAAVLWKWPPARKCASNTDAENPDNDIVRTEIDFEGSTSRSRRRVARQASIAVPRTGRLGLRPVPTGSRMAAH